MADVDDGGWILLGGIYKAGLKTTPGFSLRETMPVTTPFQPS